VHDGANAPHHSPRRGEDEYNAFGLISIGDVIDFFYRYFLLISATTLAGIAVAMAYILTASSLYTAHGQLLIDVKVLHLATEQWREAGQVLDAAQIESQIAVLRSEPVAQSVARHLNLQNDPTLLAGPAGSPGSASSSTSAPDGAAPSEAERLARATSLIQGGLGIRRVGFSYVLEISYTSPDPVFAARAANAYMQAYIEDQIEMRAGAARHGSEWLERRIGLLRLQMNEAALKVQEFKARRDYSIIGRGPAGEGADEKKASPRKGITETIEELEATAMTYRRMFESALQAYTEAEQRQSYTVDTARIIATAKPPSSKSYPKRKQALVAAVALGLLLGIGIALLREAFRFVRASRATRRELQDVR
jgi:uncharacterized protein involved in exopolysaccharide biosynthesis